ncbi:MAG: methylmalonyl-CoA epimerase [Anaerolineae bacterium]
MFKRIDHIALIVPDLDEAIALYQNSFQVEFYLRERNEEQGFEVAAFRVGDGHIELLAPTRPDSVIAGFLEKRGPGIHHVALEVDEIETRLDEVKAAGLRLINETPRRGTGNSRIAFIHPKSLGGAMLELVELP